MGKEVKDQPLHINTPTSLTIRSFSLLHHDLVFSLDYRTIQGIELQLSFCPSLCCFFFFFSDKRLSSTPLEVLFFLNGWYYATYFLLELLIFLYKGKAGLDCLCPNSSFLFSPAPTPTKNCSFFSDPYSMSLHCKAEASSADGFRMIQ